MATTPVPTAGPPLQKLLKSCSLSSCTLILLYVVLSHALLSALDALGYIACWHRLGAETPVARTGASLDVSQIVVSNPKKDERLFPTTRAIDRIGSATMSELQPLGSSLGKKIDRWHLA